jgi:hypothetical protein
VPPETHYLTLNEQIPLGLSVASIELHNIPNDRSSLSFGVVSEDPYSSTEVTPEKQSMISMSSIRVAPGSIVSVVVNTKDATIQFRHNGAVF